MRYLLLVPAVLLAAYIALVVWAKHLDTHLFDDWESYCD